MRRALTSIPLVLLALAVGFSEQLAFSLAGFKPLRSLGAEAIDDPAASDDREAPQFLAERNQVEVVVPRDMTAGELLRLYQLAEFPHVRRQIAEQEGVGELPDGHLLRQGRRYTITLTPPRPGP